MLVDAGLIRRLEDAYADLLASYAESVARIAPELGAGSLSIVGGKAIFGGRGSPYTQAAAVGLHGPVLAEDLDQIEAFLGRGGGPIQIGLLPFLAHPSFVEILGERRYRVVRLQQVLIRPLQGVADEPALAPGPDPSLRVTPVKSGEEALWCRTVTQGFVGSDEVLAEDEAFFRPAASARGYQCFLAWVGDEPAGGGVLTVDRELGYLSSTSVRPRFRGRGVQAALIRTRFEVAIRAGCSIAVTSTEPATRSQRNMERAGFRVAYPKAMMFRMPQ